MGEANDTRRLREAGLHLAAGREQEAEALLRQLLAEDPEHFLALHNLGTLLMRLGRFEEAAIRLIGAVRLHPDQPDSWAALADTLAGMGRWNQAAGAWRHALALTPADAGLQCQLAIALLATDDLAEALTLFMQALPAVQNDAAQLERMGVAFYNRGLTQQARDCFDLALAADPGFLSAAWYRLTTLLPMVAASEADIEQRRGQYESALADLARQCAARPAAARELGDRPLPLPFYLPYQGRDDRALQERFGAMIRGVMAGHPVPSPRHRRQPGDKLRIGIVSAYFRLHSNWKMPIAGWLAGLDRERFELFGYHTEDRIDACTETARSHFDHFLQGPMEIGQWIERIAADGVDALIYPEIGMDPVSGHLAAVRLAPVQCASWGHPQTSGYPTIDFFLSSALMEGPLADRHYSERLIRLPNLSISYRPDLLAGIEPARRADWGLDEGHTVYWCCQNLSKYLPEHDDVFPRIARAQEAARFCFIDDGSRREGGALFRARLESAFARLGLRWDRHCLFLPGLTQARFLGATREADLFLDSIGWSGCNSTFEALSLGLPVITLPGALMRSRHSLAILTMLGITDTIAADKTDYVGLAVALGRDTARRERLRRRILERIGTLYDDPEPVRALAAFLEQAVAEAEGTGR